MPHCKERWRNLRACLTRHLKHNKDLNNSGEGSTHKPYYLAEYMDFLMPFTKTRPPKELLSVREVKEEFRTPNSCAQHDEYADNSTDFLSDSLSTTIPSNTSISNNQMPMFIVTSTTSTPNRFAYKAETIPNTTIVPKLERNTYEPLKLVATPQKLLPPPTQASVAIEQPTTINNQQIISKIDSNSSSAMVCISAAALETLAKGSEAYIQTLKRPIDASPSILPSSANDSDLLQLSAVKKCCPSEPDQREIEDANVNFFKSLLPDIRQMTAKQKRKFKMGIYELINNILENE